MFRWIFRLFVARSQPCDAPKRAGPEAVAKVEKLKAEFEAATRIWPRDDAAIERAWQPLFKARTEQLRQELGR